jgi:hypothetical protein
MKTKGFVVDQTKSFHVRCTVSGGLEDLAEEEIRQYLSHAQIVWFQRGSSGSKLEIQCGHSDLPVVLSMRFLEYLWVPLGSREFHLDENKVEYRIPLIQEQISNIVRDSKRWNQGIDAWRTTHEIFKNLPDLGLEPIPGRLLPAIQISTTDTILKDDYYPTQHSIYAINTIFTEEKVAKAIACLFQELVKEHAPSLPNDSILWLDAGAGSGSLLSHLPKEYRIGIDIQSASHTDIHQIDFMDVTIGWLKEKASKDFTHLCMLSNPPFAEHSRGDYSGIIKFINQGVILNAKYIAVIVPEKFVRRRVWQSLGLSSRVTLIARCSLPKDSFYDPFHQKTCHLNSIFLFFETDLLPEESKGILPIHIPNNITFPFHRIRCEGSRNRGDFTWISTSELREATLRVIQNVPLEWNQDDSNELTLSTELKLTEEERKCVVELFILLNSKRPLSLANCISKFVPEHSLGWLSMSTKPATAFAMSYIGLGGSIQQDCAPCIPQSVVINCMCGEGTIELESQDIKMPSSFFMISGDKEESVVRLAAKRLSYLSSWKCQQAKGNDSIRRPLVDFVVWDTQRLPIRSGVADLVLGDLPFGGSKEKQHQTPSLSGVPKNNSLDYKRVMFQVVRVLRCRGRAALLSADCKALSNVAGVQFLSFWSVVWRSNLNLGGLRAKLFITERNHQNYKDISVWIKGSISDTDGDMSLSIEELAKTICKNWVLNDCFELQNNDSQTLTREEHATDQHIRLVDFVELNSRYFHLDQNLASHCYRIWFHPLVSNSQARRLEKEIRERFLSHPRLGMELR